MSIGQQEFEHVDYFLKGHKYQLLQLIVSKVYIPVIIAKFLIVEG